MPPPRHLFAREIELLSRLGALLPRKRRPPPPAVPRPAERRSGPEPKAPSALAGARRPGGRRGRLRAALRSGQAVAASVLIHLVVLGALVTHILPEPPAPPPEREPLVVRFELRQPPPEPPARPEPSPPEPEPEPAEPEPEPEPEAEPEDTAEEPPPGPAEDEPAPGKPEAPPVAPRPSMPLPDPRWVGLGGAPEALPEPGRGSSALGSRFSGKAEALRRGGGSAATEDAVARGLRWLAEHQNPGGGWSMAGFSRHCGHHAPCRGRGIPEHDVGGSALALLAFLGAGHTPQRDGPYRRTVLGALEHLVSVQDARGAYGPRSDAHLYDHALATLALAEATALLPRRGVGASLRKDLSRSVARAVEFSREAQQAGGGWDYTARATGRNDLSITGWQVLALKAARTAGVDLPSGLLQGARDHLDRAYTPAGEGIYADRGTGAGRRGPNMAAVGLLVHLTLGRPPDAPAARRTGERLIRSAPPDPDTFRRWDASFQSYYYWYSATLALFHLGGSRWKAWNHLLVQTLLPLQARSGHAEGSWPPEPNWIGGTGGRVYATAINVLTFEVYYRYRPIHATGRG